MKFIAIIAAGLASIFTPKTSAEKLEGKLNALREKADSVRSRQWDKHYSLKLDAELARQDAERAGEIYRSLTNAKQ